MKFSISKTQIILVVFMLIIETIVDASPITKRQSGGSHSGDGTYFNPGLGACGEQDNDSSMIVALAAPDFDPSTPNGNPNKNTLCGRGIRIYYNGKSVDGKVTDRCPECKSGDVDMSPAMFDTIADPSQGRIPITWDFI
ncbi:11588_t:CDS:1 [Ambispora leptoticha]|uniref:11588_t:CDS:1 n=1 Tax=Ambispora leptoticha TaxID=144679 RepID=A0A9N9ND55_9GLOM|nr:11588_t:CDS:1 [Ambispora leptoticha]